MTIKVLSCHASFDLYEKSWYVKISDSSASQQSVTKTFRLKISWLLWEWDRSWIQSLHDDYLHSNELDTFIAYLRDAIHEIVLGN